MSHHWSAEFIRPIEVMRSSEHRRVLERNFSHLAIQRELLREIPVGTKIDHLWFSRRSSAIYNHLESEVSGREKRQVSIAKIKRTLHEERPSV